MFDRADGSATTRRPWKGRRAAASDANGSLDQRRPRAWIISFEHDLATLEEAPERRGKITGLVLAPRTPETLHQSRHSGPTSWTPRPRGAIIGLAAR